MQNNNLSFPEDTYPKYLSSINGINFTQREIDVIACLVNARGTSKIASFLLISPRTVVTHIRNIMLKLECNSRESIIDFIEKSEKQLTLRKHYTKLVIQEEFEKCLKEISKLRQGESPSCLIITSHDQEKQNPFLSQLISYLKISGVKTSVEIHQNFQTIPQLPTEFNKNFIIYLMSVNLLERMLKDVTSNGSNALILQKLQHSKNLLFLLFQKEDDKEIGQEIRDKKFIEVLDSNTKHFVTFTILNRLFPNLAVEKITTEFKKKYENLNNLAKGATSGIFSEEQPSTAKEKNSFSKVHDLLKHRTWLSGLVFFLIASLVTWALILYGNTEISQKQSQVLNKNKENITTLGIRSDLIMPEAQVFLNRHELIGQIDEGFKKQKGIQTVALVGIGGSGKTTLARQYAHGYKATVIWELNAETTGSLKGSFEKLAIHLAKTIEDQKILKAIQSINNSTEREEQIMSFVKDRLKSSSGWLLIYDNVDAFKNIHQYFPEDFNTWGNGKVILTTRDDNIQNNNYISCVIHVGGLNPHQKLTLFCKIMNKGNSHSHMVVVDQKLKRFLAQLPPFPLDISLAGYYLKTINISYDQYLMHLKELNNDFSNVQEDLLQEAGDYKKTRYNIISLTLSQLIAYNKDFSDLLLFISLLDSQNIPRDLLNEYKSESIVESFIYYLKKYSLITHESSTSYMFSIHRSIQALSLLCLQQSLNLEKDKTPIRKITNHLEQYLSNIINKEDSLTMKSVIGHYKSFLTHNNLLSDFIKGSIGGYLGCIYFYLGDYEKAEKNLEKSLLELNKHNSKDKEKKYLFLLYLGIINREVSKNDAAKNFLEQSYMTYKNYLSKHSIKGAQILAHLGHFYYAFGEYKKAKELLEKSLIIYQKQFPESSGGARVSRYLGMSYRTLGENAKAENLFRQSVLIYKKQFSENDLGVTWALLQLGNIYRMLGKYKEANAILEKCYKTSKETFSHNHVSVAWSLKYLGALFVALGEYEKARNVYEQALSIHKKVFGDDNIKTSWVLAHLGDIEAKLGNFSQAKTNLEKNLEIHKERLTPDHLKIAWILLALGNVYHKLDNEEKAKTVLQESLAIYEKHCGPGHLATAQVLEALGKVYLLEGNIVSAENFLKKSLRIWQHNKHPEIYRALESLSAIYIAKSKAIKSNKQQFLIFKTQAIDYLKKALEIIKANFPEGSPHGIKLELQLQSLEKTI